MNGGAWSKRPAALTRGRRLDARFPGRTPSGLLQAHLVHIVDYAVTVRPQQGPARTTRSQLGQVCAVATSHSNAKSDGIKRVIKLAGRAAHGFRNPANERSGHDASPPAEPGPPPHRLIRRSVYAGPDAETGSPVWPRPYGKAVDGVSLAKIEAITGTLRAEGYGDGAVSGQEEGQ